MLLLPFPASACREAPPETLTPLTNQADETSISNYLSAMKQRYTEGITCGGTEMAPSLEISEEEFLSIDVLSETAILIEGKPYFCTAVPQQLGYLRGTIELENYTIAFDDPEPGVTRTGGGIAVKIEVFEEGHSLGVELYYDTVLNHLYRSVSVLSRSIEEIRILSLSYKPDCENLKTMTLILVPVPPPGEPPD